MTYRAARPVSCDRCLRLFVTRDSLWIHRYHGDVCSEPGDNFKRVRQGTQVMYKFVGVQHRNHAGSFMLYTPTSTGARAVRPLGLKVYNPLNTEVSKGAVSDG